MVKFPTSLRLHVLTILQFGTQGVIHKNVLVAITQRYMLWNDDLINHIQISQGVFTGALPCSAW